MPEPQSIALTMAALLHRADNLVGVQNDAARDLMERACALFPEIPEADLIRGPLYDFAHALSAQADEGSEEAAIALNILMDLASDGRPISDAITTVLRMCVAAGW